MTKSTTAAPDVKELELLARRIRGKILEMSYRAQTPHLASQLSPVDILVAAYWGALSIDPKRPDDPERDRFIFSKGHAVPALYATLALRGFFPEAELERFNEAGGRLSEHGFPGCAPGVELATGSLGHGLPVGIGLALGARLLGRKSRSYVLMSDGEVEEGSVWEAAMFAPARKLETVAAIVDFNRWQATGRSTEIMALEPLADKFKAFGWSAHSVNGHDIGALVGLLRNVPDGSGKPVAIIANTVKGKGVSFMEDDNNWHYRTPNADELAKALGELGLK